MVHLSRGNARRLAALLLGVTLLSLCTGGVVAASPSNNITITSTTTPQPPTDFTITQIGVGTINITWTKGHAANITIVRGSTVSYPFSVFDGDAVYSGNGTSVSVGSLDLSANTYYYRAWSQNDYATSTGYAQATIGSGSSSSTTTTTMGLLDLSLTGDGFGLLEMIFLIAIIGFAFWKKSWIRVLLSLCIIIWGVFAMQYDIKVAAPLLAIGTILFFMGVLNMIRENRAAQQEV